jgi:phosphatidylserine/phosphatidylglycerophosphate/cardiolipin synthase-like enzyme
VRQFFHTSRQAQNQVLALLQSVFAAELIAPSGQIWLVSPWLSDVAILDNRSGTFRALKPSWENRMLRLSELLTELVRRGSRIVVITRPHSTQVVEAVRSQLTKERDRQRFVWRYSETLHAKGLLTDDCCLSGSMNFTHNGVLRLEEMLSYQTQHSVIAQLRLDFGNEYGVEL